MPSKRLWYPKGALGGALGAARGGTLGGALEGAVKGGLGCPRMPWGGARCPSRALGGP